MKKFLFLFMLSFLLIGAESFAQKSYSSRSSFSSSRSSYSSSRSSYSPSKSYTSTRSSYKPTVTKSSHVSTKTVSKPISKSTAKVFVPATVKSNVIKTPVKTTTVNTHKITKPVAHTNTPNKFSTVYIDRTKTYYYGRNNNTMLYTTLGLMWYTLYYNNHTRQYDTIKAPNKEALEKKVDQLATKS